MGWTCALDGQHAGLAADAVGAHLRLEHIAAGIAVAGTALKAPVHLYGTISFLNLAKQVNGVARIDHIFVCKWHYLRQHWVQCMRECKVLGGSYEPKRMCKK